MALLCRARVGVDEQRLAGSEFQACALSVRCGSRLSPVRYALAIAIRSHGSDEAVAPAGKEGANRLPAIHPVFDGYPFLYQPVARFAGCLADKPKAVTFA